MRGRSLILIWTLLLGVIFSSSGTYAYAMEGSNSGNVEEDFSYFFIQYNGKKQNVIVNDTITLTLTGWADSSKSTVKGSISYNGSSDSFKDILLHVNDELNKLPISESESIQYRVTLSDTFKAELFKSKTLKDVAEIVAQNENGTSIEEVRTIDEYDTVVNNKGLIYFLTDKNNGKLEITKEKYESLNTTNIATDSLKVINQDATTISAASENNSNTVQKLSRLSVSSASTSAVTIKEPSINYSTHIQKIGWQEAVKDGALSGTEGQAKRLEAIKISLENAPYSGSITYRSHVQTYGWMPNVSAGKISGTSGESKRVEAIEIKLTGEMANYYDIYYRVHAQSFGQKMANPQVQPD